MKRRKFLKLGGIAAIPLFFGGSGLVSCQMNESRRGPEFYKDKVLVLIQLLGGNDGLNTLVPLDQYDEYVKLRPDIHLDLKGNNAIIPLHKGLPSGKQAGLHPSFSAFKRLYEDGLASIVHNVGYPSPNKSHFKSTDIWLRMEDGGSEQIAQTDGWMARFLLADSFSNGVARSLEGHPPGIQLGSRMPSLGFHRQEGAPISVNLTGQDPHGFYSRITGLGTKQVESGNNSYYSKKLDYISNVEKSLTDYSIYISDAFDRGNNISNYPDTPFAGQLKTIVRLINGGIRSRLFLTILGDFDHHVNQVLPGDAHKGRHAVLLSEMADALLSFQEDLKATGLEDRVMTMTFSEFGRKPRQNGNFGTDHGTIAPMFLFGKNVKSGITGRNPNLGLLDEGGHFKGFDYDYRQAFAAVLQDWMGAGPSTLDEAGLLPFQTSKLNLIQS